jgi:hypothetical protein
MGLLFGLAMLVGFMVIMYYMIKEWWVFVIYFARLSVSWSLFTYFSNKAMPALDQGNITEDSIYGLICLAVTIYFMFNLMSAARWAVFLKTCTMHLIKGNVDFASDVVWAHSDIHQARMKHLRKHVERLRDDSFVFPGDVQKHNASMLTDEYEYELYLAACEDGTFDKEKMLTRDDVYKLRRMIQEEQRKNIDLLTHRSLDERRKIIEGIENRHKK